MRIGTCVVASFISSRFRQACRKQQSWDRRTLPARRHALFAARPLRRRPTSRAGIVARFPRVAMLGSSSTEREICIGFAMTGVGRFMRSRIAGYNRKGPEQIGE